MKTTAKLFAFILAITCLYACDSEGDLMIYIAHPEKVKVKTPENVDYVKLYKDKVKLSSNISC